MDSRNIDGKCLSFEDCTVSIRSVVNILRENENLTEINFVRCRFADPENIKEVAQLTNLTSYRSLVGAFGTEYAKVFADGNFKNLDLLALTYGGIDSNIAFLLAKGNHLYNVSELVLIGNEIGDEGAWFLANGNLENLSILYLDENKIGEEGAKAIANGTLEFLNVLSLVSNKIGDKGSSALANGNLTNLTHLILGRNKIGDEGAKAIANGNLKLEALSLPHNIIGDIGAIGLALANSNLTNLTTLNLDNNEIGDEGATALANGNLSNLQKLRLKLNHITEAGGLEIANGNIVNLNILRLWGGKRDKEILLKLKERRESWN